MIHIDASLYNRLKDIIKSLCIWKWDVRQRLKYCHLNLFILQPHDFPAHLQNEWSDILNSLTKYWSEDIKKSPLDRHIESLDKEYYNNIILWWNFNITLWKIKNKTASKIAVKIYNIFWNLHNYYFKDNA